MFLGVIIETEEWEQSRFQLERDLDFFGGTKNSAVDGQSSSEYKKIETLLMFLLKFLHSGVAYESAEVATDMIK